MSCNSVRKGLKKAEAQPPQKFNTQLLRGPGSALKWIFVTRYRAGGCGACHYVANEMDTAGIEDVESRPTYWAEKVHKNAQNKGWLAVLDFVDYALFGLTHYESLILEACERHKNEVLRRSPPKEG